MSLVLKLMSGENGPDEDARKGFTLHSGVKTVTFKRAADGTPLASVLFEDHPEFEEWVLEGNAYVMNQAGKTVASFGAAPLLNPDDLRRQLMAAAVSTREIVKAERIGRKNVGV